MRAEGATDTAVNAKKITARRPAFAVETLSFRREQRLGSRCYRWLFLAVI
jgi:hypothetical protein